MSDNDWNDDEYDGSDSGSSAIKELRKANKAKDAELAKATEELAKLRTQVRTINIRDTLQSKGVNPKIAALVPQDLEPTSEAISKWVDDFADVFGIQVNTEPEAPQGLSQEDVQSIQRINQTVDSGTPAASPGSEQDMAARIAAAQTPEELTALIRSVGNPRS